MRKFFILLACFVFISLSLSSNTKATTNNSTENNKIISNVLNSSNSMYNITNNTDLQIKSLSGAGTSGSPYIIGNFAIDNCSTNDIGIDIQNTTDYFILQNVSVYGCQIGIQLTNVTHGSISNSHVNSSLSTGILLDSTSNTSLINNFITTSPNEINLTNSNFNTIANNSASLAINSYYSLLNSSNNILLNNTISNNYNSGIGFQLNSSSNYNYLGQSNVYIKNGTGFSITQCKNNSIEDNYVLNSIIGFNLQAAPNTAIINNTITNNITISTSTTGIYIKDSVNCNISINSVQNTYFGYNITDSNSNTIINNSATTVGVVNFALSNSSNNILFNNTILNSYNSSVGFQVGLISNNNYLGNNSVNIPEGTGFRIISSYYTTLENNHISNITLGFLIQFSSHTTVYNNNILNLLFLSSTSTGIYIQSSTDCNVTFNSVYGTFFGYNFTYSDYNSVSFNLATSVIGYNFFLLESNFNSLTNNSVISIDHSILGGFVLQNSNNNTLASNSVNTIGGPEYVVNSSNSNLLQNNSGINTQDTCFQLVNASNNNLVGNTASSCSVGINLINSNNNTLENNSVTFSQYGFLLNSSSYNTLIGNYGANNTKSDYLDNMNATNTLINNSFNSQSTSSSSLSLPPGPPGNFVVPWNINFPELTIVAFLLFLPLAGLFVFRSFSGGKKNIPLTLNLANDFNFKEKHYLSLFLLGPIIAFFATIYYSNKHRNLDYFDLKSNELRGKILTVLDDQNFIHFNKLKDILGCGVSILKWHIQVLHEFNIVNWEKIGQYKVIYLVEKPPKTKEVNLYYSLTNEKVVMILEQFMKINTWKIDNLANKSFLRKDSVMHHCKKLSSINILKENPQTHEFSMPPDSKEIVKKILFQKVYYSSKRNTNVSL